MPYFTGHSCFLVNLPAKFSSWPLQLFSNKHKHLSKWCMFFYLKWQLNSPLCPILLLNFDRFCTGHLVWLKFTPVQWFSDITDASKLFFKKIKGCLSAVYMYSQKLRALSRVPTNEIYVLQLCLQPFGREYYMYSTTEMCWRKNLYMEVV